MKLTLLASLLSLTTLCFAQASNAVNFDGTDDLISSTYSGIIGNSPRSIEAWIRTTANSNPSTGGTQQVIVDWGSFVTGGRSTFCMVWGNAIRFEAGGNGLSGTTAINDGSWHHVAMTYNPNAAQSVKLYLDGALEAQGNLTVSVNTVLGTDVTIGERIDGVNGFNGDIDEVRIWSKALTLAEIQANMNKELCSPDPDLELYYTFNQGTAGGSNTNVFTAFDQFGSNHGALQNFTLTGASSNWVSGASLTNGVNGSSIVDTACRSYTLAGGRMITTTGTYEDTVMNATGCDSIISYDITIRQVNTTVSRSGLTFTAQEAGANYQWVQCDNNYATINGETQQVFVATQNGDYAVIVTVNGCSDTSNCFTVSGIGTEEHQSELFRAYPNPSSDGKIVLESFEGSGALEIRIIDMQGKVQQELKLKDRTQRYLQLDSGVYLMEVKQENRVETRRLVVL